MEKKILVLSEKCGLILAAVFCFLNWRVSLGIVTGLVFYRVYFLLLASGIEDAINGHMVAPFGSILRILCLAIPLLLGVKFPQYFNIWGILAGLAMFLVGAVIYAVRKK